MTTLVGGTLVVLAAVVGASGCSTSSSPEAGPSASSSSSATSSGSPAPPSPGSTTLERSRCRVAGFVPSTRTVVVSQRREPLYGSGLALDPGIGQSAPVLQYFRNDVRPGAVVVSPQGVALDPAVLRATERAVSGTSAAALPAEKRVRRTVRNRTGRSVDLALYLDARVVRTRWTARECGGLTNDGTSVTVVRGRTTTVGPLAFHAVDCRSTARIPRRILAEACERG